MTGLIPEETIQQIAEAVDIVEVISQYVPLRPSGKNFRGLCPFHTEKTPSFTVSPEKQIFYCFGCRAGGNVFNFLMRYERISYPEAVRALAEQVGISVRTAGGEDAERQRKRREELLRVNAAAARAYQAALRESRGGRLALDYLSSRGVAAESIETFGLGYAPQGWDYLLKLLRNQGISVESIEAAGLIQRSVQTGRHYDRFRHRIVFPIHDVEGRVLAFGGRTLTSDRPDVPKYLNSPETYVFSKGNQLYGLNLAKDHIRQERNAFICEGYLDLIAMHQNGFRNAVATSGTALTKGQVSLLRRFADEVVLVFDGDVAGAAAAERGWDILLQHSMGVRVLPLPAGEDPDSFLRSNSEEFRARAREAPPYVDFCVGAICSSRDLQSAEGKVECVKEVARVLAKVPSAAERDQYLGQVAHVTGVNPEIILAELETHLPGGRRPGRPALTPETVRLYWDKSRRYEKAEEEVVQLLLQDEALWEELPEELVPQCFKHNVWRTVFAVLWERRRCGDKIYPSDILGLFSEPETADHVSQLLIGVRRHDETDNPAEVLRQHAAVLKGRDAPAREEEMARLLERVQDAERRGNVEELDASLAALNALKRQPPPIGPEGGGPTGAYR